MRTYLDCVPCFVRQALDAAKMASHDPVLHECILRETLVLAAEMPFDHPPPWMGQKIHRLLREATGRLDPYREMKERSNAIALALYPELQSQVRTSADPFATAVRLAIAGNVIDFGCKSHLDDDDVRQAIRDAMDDALDQATVDELRWAVEEAQDILYLADNAGEIVFDRLLIEEMPAERITLVVKGGPVINDATRQDVEATGLDSLVAVMDNGSDVPGTILESCSPTFRRRFEQSDLVIAKGQGNYETLNRENRDIFFLVKAKCPVIARDIGCEIGQAVIVRRRCGQPDRGSHTTTPCKTQDKVTNGKAGKT